MKKVAQKAELGMDGPDTPKNSATGAPPGRPADKVQKRPRDPDTSGTAGADSHPRQAERRNQKKRQQESKAGKPRATAPPWGASGQPGVPPDPARGRERTGRQEERAAKRTHDRTARKEAKGTRSATEAEATQLGVDPATWTRVKRYWAETTPENERRPLEGYPPETLTRRDLSLLKEGKKLNWDVINEVGRRITAHAPHVAFLDSTFLELVAPVGRTGSKCRPGFWTRMIGRGDEAKLGIAKTVVITPHAVPDHWCCVTADLRRRTLHYYDPFFPGPHRAEALNEMGAYVDQVQAEQSGSPIGAATFERTLIESPRQPDGVSCGVCVIIEIQRAADRETEEGRARTFTEAELLRCRAKWACELLANPTPAPPRAPRGRTDDPDGEGGDSARKRRMRDPDAGCAKETQKRPRSAPTKGENRDTSTKRWRPSESAPTRGAASQQPRADRAGIPLQDLSVGEKVPREGDTRAPSTGARITAPPLRAPLDRGWPPSLARQRVKNPPPLPPQE